MSHHHDRTVAYLRQLTAELLEHQAERGVLVTLTNFRLDRRGPRTTAQADVTVWPEAAEAATLRRLRRLYQPWRELVSERTRKRLAPRINFSIDEEAKRLNRVDKALGDLKIKEKKNSAR